MKHTSGTKIGALFKAYGRFWHWCQAFLIIFMAFTGFEIHGTYEVFGFETVVELHTWAAWALIYLWLFSIFSHLTTGEWRQYIPTRGKVIAMAPIIPWGYSTVPNTRSVRLP